MPFYKDHVYPHLVTVLGNPKPIDDIRRRILPLAQGSVLEIGVGPAVNFTYYDPARVNKVYALEPNPGMLRRAEEQRRRTQVKIEFLDLPGEDIPLADESIDTVVSTFTLCHVTRDVPSLLGNGSFNVEQMDAGHLSPFPKSGSYCWWGMANPGPRN